MKLSHLLLPVVVLGALVLAPACGGSPTSPDGPLTVTHLTRLDYATSAFNAETMFVITDPKTWQSKWTQMNASYSPTPALPAVDFMKNMVIVAAMGTKPTGGYAVSITGATAQSGTISVSVTETSPGTNCLVSEALTSPVDIATVPLQSGTVTFNVTRNVLSCTSPPATPTSQMTLLGFAGSTIPGRTWPSGPAALQGGPRSPDSASAWVLRS